jgi:hypothetical protein
VSGPSARIDFSMALFRIYTLTGAIVIAAATSLLWVNARKKSPEQLETLRRQRINTQGRITDGTVLDVQEFDSATGNSVRMIHYSYDVRGVQYECAQDVTPLRQLLNPNTCRIGVATSVKYDPQSPGNSIVVAETWCGLRS